MSPLPDGRKNTGAIFHSAISLSMIPEGMSFSTRFAKEPLVAGQNKNAEETNSDGRISPAAFDILRGSCRLLKSLGFSTVSEVTLRNNRRADLVAINRNGDIWIIEIKSSLEDYRVDQKWPDYKDFCDTYYFAVNAEFPVEIIPESEGVIIADRYGADILRPAETEKLSGARRKTVLLRAYETAANRLQNLADPIGY